MTLSICCSPSLFPGCYPSVSVSLREAEAGKLQSAKGHFRVEISFFFTSSCGWFHCLYAVCSKSHNFLLMSVHCVGRVLISQGTVEFFCYDEGAEGKSTLVQCNCGESTC